MGKNLNTTENWLCNDFGDSQSAKWLLVTNQAVSSATTSEMTFPMIISPKFM